MITSAPRLKQNGTFGSGRHACYWHVEVFAASTELAEVKARFSSIIPSPICHSLVICHSPGTTNTVDPQVDAVENLGKSELADKEIGNAENLPSSPHGANRFVLNAAQQGRLLS